MTDRVAALTGASGFLGRRLAHRLQDQGWRVRALLRRPLDPALWEGAAPQPVEGHLGDDAALGKLVDGAALVIHCAGLVSARTAADFFAANADGARRVAEATAAAPGAARMVLVSSLAAREPGLSDYAASKKAGEDAALGALPAGRLCVVRPPAIYGPGDRATLDVFKLAARSPILPVLDEPAARLALIHVDDAAAEIVRLACAPATAVVALGGDRPSGYSWREVMAAAGAAVGRRPPLLPVPSWMVGAAGGALGLLARATGRPAVFSPGKAREMRHLDWSVAPDELPTGPAREHFPLESGFRHTVAWYRRQGWL